METHDLNRGRKRHDAMIFLIELFLIGIITVPISYILPQYTNNSFWCLVIPVIASYYFMASHGDTQQVNGQKKIGLKSMEFGILSLVILVGLSYVSFKEGKAVEALKTVLVEVSNEKDKIDITLLRGQFDFYEFAITQGYKIKSDEDKLFIVKKKQQEL